MKSPSRNWIWVAILLVMLGAPKEAFMGQVHYQEIPHDWEYSLNNAPVIVLARRNGPAEIYSRKVFPRETHYNQNQETVAIEGAQPYEIIEVIRQPQGNTLGEGQTLRVWREPEYSADDLEYYHRTGTIFSPFILVKVPHAEVKDGRVILFLEPHKDIWRHFNQSPEEGEGLLQRRGTDLGQNGGTISFQADDIFVERVITLPSGEAPYTDQSLVLQEIDFNFDGRQDILINQGPMGCYGSSAYRYYLSTADGRFVNHPGLDRLADIHCHLSPDFETELIIATDGRDGTTFRSTWYDCFGQECQKVRELVQEIGGS